MLIPDIAAFYPDSVAALGRDSAAVAVLLVAALVVELVYRVYLFGPAGLTVRKLNSVQPLGRTGLIRASACPEIVFELIPNLDAWFKLARLKTNAEGLADREYSRSKPADVFRIVVLGSSFSMPAGVALEDSWHKRLEYRLNALGSGRYEVINFSVGGYDPRQLLATLKHRAAAYDPDLILVDATLKSPWILRREEVYATPFKPHPHGRPFLRSFVLDALAPPPPGTDAAVFLPADQSRAQFRQIVAQFGSFARGMERPLCFVLLQHDPSRLEEAAALAAEIGQAGAGVIDTSPAFAGRKFADLVILKTDSHPNARAHDLFAANIFDALVRRRLVGEVA